MSTNGGRKERRNGTFPQTQVKWGGPDPSVPCYCCLPWPCPQRWRAFPVNSDQEGKNTRPGVWVDWLSRAEQVKNEFLLHFRSTKHHAWLWQEMPSLCWFCNRNTINLVFNFRYRKTAQLWICINSANDKHFAYWEQSHLDGLEEQEQVCGELYPVLQPAGLFSWLWKPLSAMWNVLALPEYIKVYLPKRWSS